METPIGTIETKFLDGLTKMIIEFENEMFPFDKDNIRIYMSKAIERVICHEAGKVWKYTPIELKEFMGYKILPDYNHRLTIVDIEDMEFRKIKQLRIQMEAK